MDKVFFARLQDLRNRIAHGDQTVPALPDRAEGATPIPPGMDPVTWAAAQFDLLSRMAGDASATLVRYRRGRRFTPEELLEIGGAVIEQQVREEQEGKSHHRRASGE